MTIEALTRDVAELKRRLDLAETKLAQQAGQFEFISGQLRDVQLYPHSRFADVDAAFDGLDTKMSRLEAKFDSLSGRVERMDTKVDALPRAIAEMIAKR